MDDTHAERQQRLLKLVAEAIVRPSFQRCCEHGEAFFDEFYSSLAEHIPGVGAMFADTDMSKQNGLICEGIRSLIDYAGGNDDAARELQHLGKLHSRRHLTIQPTMYIGWVEALVETVARHDSQYTEDIDIAWREVLEPGIDVMTSLY